MSRPAWHAAVGLRVMAWAVATLSGGTALGSGGCGGAVDHARSSTDASPGSPLDGAREAEPDAHAPGAGGAGTVVLFGGADANTLPTQVALGDTWLWDGTVWTPVLGAVAPPARSAHAMATLNGAVVLFGGDDGMGNLLSDTWTWDGNAWALRNANPTPTAAESLAMATSNDRIMQFGGYRTTQVSNETWTWDGTNWALVQTSVSPPARRDHAMAVLGGQVVLFGGGALRSSSTMGDQWTWDGATWTAETGAGKPDARRGHSLAALGSKVVLFGGESCDAPPICNLLNDTWEWDGATWSQASPAVSPSARQGAAMATLGDKVVLFGGAGTDFFNDTWEWDGTTWTERHPAVAPPGRYQHAMSSRP